jgi:hypothetical protein
LRKTTCKRGHDVTQWGGRYADGHCQRCQRDYVQSAAYADYRYSGAGWMAQFHAYTNRMGRSTETPEARKARLVQPGWRRELAAQRTSIAAAQASGALPGEAYGAVFMAAYAEAMA